jgi:hypothetical protein
MILAAEVEGQAPEESSSPNTSTSNANEGATDHPVSSSKLRFPRFLRRTHSASYANPRDVPPYALFLRAKRVSMFLFQIARSSADRLDRLRRIFHFGHCEPNPNGYAPPPLDGRRSDCIGWTSMEGLFRQLENYYLTAAPSSGGAETTCF